MVLLMIFEESYIFFPEKYPAGRWEVTEQRSGAEGETIVLLDDVWMTTPDGVRLHGWWCRPHRVEQGVPVRVESRAVLLWCHGNAGNISDRYRKLVPMVRFPADVLIFDYRGYGRSGGSPSEAGVYTDALTAWNHLTGELGYEPGQVVLYGVSLGGAVAVELATKVEAAGLIVESSFTSIPDMAAMAMPFVPRAIIRTRMNSLARIATIEEPKLFIHSPVDEVIPFEMGRRLFERAGEPKRFYEVQDAGHNETDLVGGDAYFQAIREFVDEVTQGARPAIPE